MKAFFRITVTKVVLWILLFVSFVPFVMVERKIYCILGTDCPQYTYQSLLYYLYKNSMFLGIKWLVFIIGVALSYLIACLIFTLNKKDIVISALTVALQFGSAFLAQEIIVGNSSSEIILAICLMLVLAFLNYGFFGKRKRNLFFTLPLPTILLASLIF